MRAIPPRPGAAIDPAKVHPELVLTAWACSGLDFFAAKVVMVNLTLGTATILWDADGDGEWDEDEEEVPLAFMRSVTGKEDMDPEKVRLFPHVCLCDRARALR